MKGWVREESPQHLPSASWEGRGPPRTSHQESSPLSLSPPGGAVGGLSVTLMVPEVRAGFELLSHPSEEPAI